MEQQKILKKIKIYNWLFSIAFMYEIYFNINMSLNLTIFAIQMIKKLEICKRRKKVFSKKLLDVEPPHDVSKQSQKVFKQL